MTCIRCRSTFLFRLCPHCGKRPDERRHRYGCPNS